jgi:hypothetical protein
MTARQAVAQITELSYKLHMIGVLIDGPDWIVGDTQSDVTSASGSHSALSRRHNASSYFGSIKQCQPKSFTFGRISAEFSPCETQFLRWTKILPLFNFFCFGKSKLSKMTISIYHSNKSSRKTKEKSPSVQRGLTSANRFSTLGMHRIITGNKSKHPENLDENPPVVQT